MAEKKFPKGIYGKVVNTPNGTITKVSINKQQFIDYLQSTDENETYLNLDILKRANPTDKQTHYVVVDEWKPTPKTEVSVETEKQTSQEDDLFAFDN